MKTIKTIFTPRPTKSFSRYIVNTLLIMFLTSLFTIASVFAQTAKDKAAKAVEFYIAPGGNDANDGSLKKPFATIGRARDAIRTLRQKGQVTAPVNVYFRGGFYWIEEPVIFTPEDSGDESTPITYMAYQDERPVISGGRLIKGWTKGANGVWTTVIDQVKSGNWYFNQIAVNGQFRNHARTPNEGVLRVKSYTRENDSIFEFAPGQFNPRWKNLDDVRVVVYNLWVESFFSIRSIDTVKHIVTFRQKARGFNGLSLFQDDFTTAPARYIIDNVYEGLDAPGEWYLDRITGVLSYMSTADENMQNAEVIAPFAQSLITLQGDPLNGKLINDLNFRNLTFQNTSYQLPANRRNSGGQGGASVKAAITATGLNNCTFEGCNFNNLGTFALELGNGSTNNRFIHNTLTGLASGGIRVNGGAAGSNPLSRTGFNVFTDNTIAHYGLIYPASNGMMFQATLGNVISHNLIYDGFESGISVGWVWGYMPSISRDNIVEFNYIHHIGKGLLSDLAGIYTLGVSPGTVIRNNLIHDVDANTYGAWGIYMDEGSSHLLIEKNVVYNTKNAAFNIHYSREVVVRNNIFAFSKLDLLQRQRPEPHISVYFETNIMYWTQGKLLSNDWTEPSYTFYYKAIAPTSREMTSNFSMDYNLYYNPKLPVDSVRFAKQTLAQWQARGKDVNSIIADPMFEDAEHFNFKLKPGSPAFKLGFKQIDLSTVGPRK